MYQGRKQNSLSFAGAGRRFEHQGENDGRILPCARKQGRDWHRFLRLTADISTRGSSKQSMLVY